MMVPLYRRLLGERFGQLPPRVRELHDLRGRSVWVGRADVERGRSWASRIAGALTSLPAAGMDQPLRVTFEARGPEELWTRRFGSATFPSVQYERGGRLHERTGPVTFAFALGASTEGLTLELAGLRAFGVPVPRSLHPAIVTFESEREGRYHFEVEARLPLFGLLVRYAGWLERAEDGASA
jgi:hypothetical protein